MRLNKFLSEAIKPQLMKAVRITQKGQLEFLSQLQKHWDKYGKLDMSDLERMLSVAFINYNIEFDEASRRQEKEQEEGYSKNTFILGGLHDLEGMIYLQLSNITPKILSSVIKKHKGDVFRISDKTSLFDEIQNILSHELVHREAFKKAGVKMFPAEKRFNLKKYLRDTQEIVAFGQQYANDVYLKRESDIEELYREIFGKTHKVYKKFMKVYRNTLDKLKKGEYDRALD